MAITDLSHVNLRAHRQLLDELRDFYVDVVGLRVGDRPPFKSSGYWLYAGEQAIVHLVEAGPADQCAIANDSILDHVAFAVTNLDSVEACLRQRGIDFAKRDVPLTDQRQIFFKDPAGNGIELIVNLRDQT
jgi:glyoxylase I family protein